MASKKKVNVKSSKSPLDHALEIARKAKADAVNIPKKPVAVKGKKTVPAALDWGNGIPEDKLAYLNDEEMALLQAHRMFKGKRSYNGIPAFPDPGDTAAHDNGQGTSSSAGLGNNTSSSTYGSGTSTSWGGSSSSGSGGSSSSGGVGAGTGGGGTSPTQGQGGSGSGPVEGGGGSAPSASTSDKSTPSSTASAADTSTEEYKAPPTATGPTSMPVNAPQPSSMPPGFQYGNPLPDNYGMTYNPSEQAVANSIASGTSISEGYPSQKIQDRVPADPNRMTTSEVVNLSQTPTVPEQTGLDAAYDPLTSVRPPTSYVPAGSYTGNPPPASQQTGLGGISPAESQALYGMDLSDIPMPEGTSPYNTDPTPETEGATTPSQTVTGPWPGQSAVPPNPAVYTPGPTATTATPAAPAPQSMPGTVNPVSTAPSSFSTDTAMDNIANGTSIVGGYPENKIQDRVPEDPIRMTTSTGDYPRKPTVDNTVSLSNYAIPSLSDSTRANVFASPSSSWSGFNDVGDMSAPVSPYSTEPSYSSPNASEFMSQTPTDDGYADLGPSRGLAPPSAPPANSSMGMSYTPPMPASPGSQVGLGGTPASPSVIYSGYADPNVKPAYADALVGNQYGYPGINNTPTIGNKNVNVSGAGYPVVSASTYASPNLSAKSTADVFGNTTGFPRNTSPLSRSVANNGPPGMTPNSALPPSGIPGISSPLPPDSGITYNPNINSSAELAALDAANRATQQTPTASSGAGYTAPLPGTTSSAYVNTATKQITDRAPIDETLSNQYQSPVTYFDNKETVAAYSPAPTIKPLAASVAVPPTVFNDTGIRKTVNPYNEDVVNIDNVDPDASPTDRYIGPTYPGDEEPAGTSTASRLPEDSSGHYTEPTPYSGEEKTAREKRMARRKRQKRWEELRGNRNAPELPEYVPYDYLKSDYGMPAEPDPDIVAFNNYSSTLKRGGRVGNSIDAALRIARQSVVSRNKTR